MKRKLIFLMLSSTLLAACGKTAAPDTQEGTGEEATEQTTEKGGAVVPDNALGTSFYRPALLDGAYQPSKSRGITLRMNSSVNLKSFETGLMRLSQAYYPTKDYLFQEGQMVPSDTIQSWIGRESEENPQGLNPADNGKKEPDERNPIYLQTILEQDYYKQTENGPKLAGISMGLGMNLVDYYRKEQFGWEFETNLTREQLLKEGQKMADQMIKQMRELDGVGELPIMVAIFEQAPRDNLAGGVYISRGISQKGAGSVGEWTAVNERKEVFPLTGSDTNEGNSFKNFKSEVESFFPNLSGVTGVAHYFDDQLADLNVDIVTQFYGAGEMIAFTQYVTEAAGKFLPPNIRTSITIESLDGVEAILMRNTGETEFEAHVFTD